jgi:hypothetical protein
MKWMKSLWSIGAVSFLLACAPRDEAYRYYLNERFPPKEPEEVAVLSAKPSREFTVMADFQALGGSDTRFQEAAAEIGADAIIITRVSRLHTGTQKWAGEDTSSSDSEFVSDGVRVVVTAIRYR